MTDDDLRQGLRKLPAPPPADDAARERARHRALMAFGAQQSIPDRAPFPWRNWGFATAIVLLAALFLRPQARTQRTNDAALLAQTEALFPGQLDAVIERGTDVQIELDAEPTAVSDQRLWIEFRRGTERVRILGYSGRRACIEIDGRKVCFEPLLDERDGVILTGDDFLWRSGQRNSVAGWQIAAARL